MHLYLYSNGSEWVTCLLQNHIAFITLVTEAYPKILSGERFNIARLEYDINCYVSKIVVPSLNNMSLNYDVWIAVSVCIDVLILK